jgi:hypothetical protein
MLSDISIMRIYLDMDRTIKTLYISYKESALTPIAGFMSAI